MNVRYIGLILIFTLLGTTGSVAQQSSGPGQSSRPGSASGPNTGGQSGGAGTQTRGATVDGADAQGQRGMVGGSPSTRMGTTTAITGAQQISGAAKTTPAPATLSLDQAIQLAIQEAQPGDVVLLAGKGHETYQVLKDRTIHFDDRETAREVLRSFGYRGNKSE